MVEELEEVVCKAIVSKLIELWSDYATGFWVHFIYIHRVLYHSGIFPIPTLSRKQSTKLGATFDEVEGCQMNTPVTRMLEPLTRIL
jgi:hypothetical protein